jgi:methylated-DNA-[protein]-cysteine S-methyltransferase
MIVRGKGKRSIKRRKKCKYRYSVRRKYMYYSIYESPISPMIIVGDEIGITNIYLNKVFKESFNKYIRNDKFFEKVINQLDDYFHGKLYKFDLKLNPIGTDFQKKVWNKLVEIPYGQVCSYKDIANSIGNIKACRAVGMANSKNPIPIIIPCHRVIGSNGRLTGYAGGLDVKEKLLNLEGIVTKGNKILK